MGSTWRATRAKALPLFAWLACVGFALSLLVHVLSIAGIAVPGGKAVFALQFGIFVVWIPAVLVGARIRRAKIILDPTSKRLSLVARLIFVYGGISFLLFTVGTAHDPASSSASPHNVVAALRSFSSVWLIFYSKAFAVLYAASRKTEPLS